MRNFMTRLGWFALIIPITVFFVTTHVFAEYIVSRPLNGWIQLVGLLVWIAICSWAVFLVIKTVNSLKSKNQ